MSKKLEPIKNGTVLDHLPSKSALKVLDLLELDYSDPVTIAINTNSTRFGKKDLIFIENKKLSKKEVEKIGLIAEGVTWNILEDGKIASKTKIALPKKAINIITCPNPKCITNYEPINTKFQINQKNNTVTCEYCNREIEKGEIIKKLKQ